MSPNADSGGHQWFHDQEFAAPLPEDLAAEIVRYYGTGQAGVDFAQALASFIRHTDWRVVKVPPNTSSETGGDG